MASVLLTSDAKEDLRDLNHAAQVLVLKALKKLETEPEKRGAPLGAKGGSNLTTFRKLVAGKQAYRVIYRVEGDEIVVVWVVGGRADDYCYELATSRLALYETTPDLQAELAELIDAVWKATEIP